MAGGGGFYPIPSTVYPIADQWAAQVQLAHDIPAGVSNAGGEVARFLSDPFTPIAHAAEDDARAVAWQFATWGAVAVVGLLLVRKLEMSV